MPADGNVMFGLAAKCSFPVRVFCEREEVYRIVFAMRTIEVDGCDSNIHFVSWGLLRDDEPFLGEWARYAPSPANSGTKHPIFTSSAEPIPPRKPYSDRHPLPDKVLRPPVKGVCRRSDLLCGIRQHLLKS